jgi:hypothetical protein
MEQSKEGFVDGYAYAREEILDRILEVEGLDSWTIERLCDMIESNKI